MVEPLSLPQAAQSLVRVLDAPSPCGPDLSYDAEFLALESTALGKREQQFGETLIPAEPPDWREVERRAQSLLERTQDLRIGVLLCRAWTGLHGVPGLSDGMALLVGLMECHGDAVHPWVEDGDDFMRTNALASLDDVTGLVRQLRDAELLRSSLGGLRVREAEAIVRGMPAGEQGHRMTADQLRAAVADGWRQHDPILGAVVSLRQRAQRLQSLFEHEATGQRRVDLGQLLALMGLLAELLPLQTAVPLVDTLPTGEMTQATPASATPPPAGLHTRDDAMAQLLQVAAFLERTEPTSPAPLLIRRAVRLMGMDFIEIVRELSPDSLAQVETITGVRPQA
jgi:type VI secretion system protein ImpA